jgi:hypothetical protein
MMSVEQSVEWELAGKKCSKKTCPSVILSTISPTWPNLGSNLGRRSWKPASNRITSGRRLPMFRTNQWLGGRLIAQAVSHRLPTTPAQVQSHIRSCGIYGGQSGAGASFLWVLRFLLPILILSIAPYLAIIRSWYNRPDSGRRTEWTQSHRTPLKMVPALGFNFDGGNSSLGSSVNDYQTTPCHSCGTLKFPKWYWLCVAPGSECETRCVLLFNVSLPFTW